MNTEHKKWLTYWKKNLSDSLNNNIDVDNSGYFEIENFKTEDQLITELQKVNNLIDLAEQKINDKKGIKNKGSAEWICIEHTTVVIAPFKLKPLSEHLVYLKDKKPKFPFWFSAYLDRKGKLYIPEETYPLFQRKYLEPLADERTDFIFGSVENVDKAITLGQEKYKRYSEYIHNVNNVFERAINQKLTEYHSEGYETIFNAVVLLPQEDMNAAIGIIQLYEKILKNKNTPPLLESLITLKNNVQRQPIAVSKLIDFNELHLGQMRFDFPLSISQRKSLNTFSSTTDKVFAVNGPPGTGKTTLLQSIVANKFVESALEGKNAPIILACSSNNQAVTNIIESFSQSKTKDGKLQGRWIPDVDGYATYLPSSSKTVEELKGTNYKKLDGKGLFGEIENHEYLSRAKEFFLEKSKEYLSLPILTISVAAQKLQSEIVYIKENLKKASSLWKEYLKSENEFTSKYLSYNSESNSYFKEGILNEYILLNDIQKLTATEKRIITYFKDEPFRLSLKVQNVFYSPLKLYNLQFAITILVQKKG